MRYIFTILLLVIASQAYSQVKEAEVQIAETLRALPEALRDEAAVIGYNQAGEQIELRKGSNDMICWADDPELSNDKGKIYIVCFPKSLEPYMTRIRKLRLNGVSNVYDSLSTEIEFGLINIPKLAVRYTLRGHSHEGALPLTIIHVPYATTESTGFSSEIDNFRPWLMWEGTPHAHIMVPGH
jgi:hypothetical protein